MVEQPNLFFLGAVGVVLGGSLVLLIWRSWHQEGTSLAEQRALLAVGANIVFAPAATLVIALLLRPTLGILGGFALVATTLSLALLPKIHGNILGGDGLFRRVRNLTLYYSYLFLFLSQFPKIHVTVAWYLADSVRAHGILLAALFLPGLLTLVSARPAGEEWRKWWPIRQWSALFLVCLLALWMGLSGH